MPLDGQTIRNLRVSNGFSQEKLASMSNVSKRTVQRAEKGEAIALETLNFLAEALGVSPEELHAVEEKPEKLELQYVTAELGLNVPPSKERDIPLVSPPQVRGTQISSSFKKITYLSDYLTAGGDDPQMAYRSKLLAFVGFIGGLLVIAPIFVYLSEWYSGTYTLTWQTGWSLFAIGIAIHLFARLLDWYLFVQIENEVDPSEALHIDVSGKQHQVIVSRYQLKNATWARVRRRLGLKAFYFFTSVLLLSS